MIFDQIGSNVSRWFDASGPESEVVISSRIRLARNLAGHKFVSTCDDHEKAIVMEKLKKAIMSLNSDFEKNFVDICNTTQLQKDFLIERHLISRNLAKNEGPRGAIISDNEYFTAMLNEEDHLRMQVILPGLQLRKCWDTINSIDDEIEEQLRYAFDPKYGYLTACPTNVGTGIRVSVMLHLPALKATSQIEKLLNAARDMKLAVRGLFGEGTEAIGDFFQISNQVTLGLKEEDIIEKFTDILIPKIVEYELTARDHLLHRQTNVLDDKIYRAEGILRNAFLISSQEALFLLSQLRLGVNLKRVTNISMKTINELFMLTQPAHLQKNAGHQLNPEERDRLRASIIREKLKNN